MNFNLKPAKIAILISCLLTSAVMAFAQAPQAPGGRGPLGFLKRAISEAGAPDLTSDQETQLTTLVKAFHESNATDAERQAHQAYNAAILAGDLAAAQAQAGILAQFASTHLHAAAKLEIDVLNILKAGGQLDALRAKFGDGLVQVLGSLAGGPGFGGPGRPGGGPGRPGDGPGGGRPRTPPQN